jgi:hypothetical protein
MAQTPKFHWVRGRMTDAERASGLALALALSGEQGDQVFSGSLQAGHEAHQAPKPSMSKQRIIRHRSRLSKRQKSRSADIAEVEP